MIERTIGMLKVRTGAVSDASHELEERGHACLRGVLTGHEVETLRSEVERIFEEFPPDVRNPDRSQEDEDMFRYEMLNRSALCQETIAHPAILEVIEPLLGDDCHVIANTAWRNPAAQPGMDDGQFWHIDAGPHVPRPVGTVWPAEIPYPVFAIGTHILLRDQTLADGPTGVISGSHRSGQHPPFDRIRDARLEYDGERCRPLLGAAGDVLLFVSDVWHRRMRTLPSDAGRFFLQVHYGRRDIAQRIRVTTESGQLASESRARADTARKRSIIGLHDPFFYDG